MSNELAVRQSITNLADAMDALPDHSTQEDYATEHRFATGVYSRKVTLPANEIVVGKIHRRDNLIMLLRGSCWMSSTEGCKKLDAPVISLSKAGIQRAVYTLTECVFVSIHGTDTTDLKQLETELISPNYKSLEVL